MPSGPAAQHRRHAPARHDIRSVALVSLGCPKNLVDSEKMLGLLAESGLAPVAHDPDDPDSFGGADAVVVNTCGFLEASKEESLGVIRQALDAKRRGLVKRVVVAGCLVQRHRARLLDWAPGIDALVGVFDRDRIVHAVRGSTPARQPSPRDTPDAPAYWIAANALHAARDRGLNTVGLTVHGADGRGIGYFEDDSARLRLTPRHYAYLRVSEGCNQNCAFCTIPSIRGKMRSKPIPRLLDEARELLLDGAFELLLIGQDTTSYGHDIGIGLDPHDSPDSPFARGLPLLLQSLSDLVDQHAPAGWIRLMYAYPSNFSAPIIDAFAQLVERGRLIPYLDIPLQHASDRILAAMRRHVTAAAQESLLRELRRRVPNLAIRTTFISGFPGETEDDHRRLLDFVERMRFDALGVFEYSPEEGTVAGTMEKDPALAVPPDVKARRRGEIMRLQQRLVFERNRELASRFNPAYPASGHRADVLIDRPLRARGRETPGVSRAARLYQGRTTAQAPDIDAITYVQASQPLSPGELIRCVITGADGYDLIAHPLHELDKRLPLPILK